MDFSGIIHGFLPDLAFSQGYGEERLINTAIFHDSLEQSVLSAKKIRKKFGRMQVLKSVDIQIRQGDCIILIGENGVGKSTLIRILSGTMRPDFSESLMICGKELSISEESRKKIGLICHQTMLYSDLSALENLQFFSRLYGIKNEEEKIGTLLDRFGLSLRKNDPIRSYSRGMQQRIAICRALINEPELLLMDEPFTGLDEKGTRILNDVILEMKSQKKAVLLSTHDPNSMKAIATKLLKLEKGMITGDAE